MSTLAFSRRETIATIRERGLLRRIRKANQDDTNESGEGWERAVCPIAPRAMGAEGQFGGSYLWVNRGHILRQFHNAGAGLPQVPLKVWSVQGPRSRIRVRRMCLVSEVWGPFTQSAPLHTGPRSPESIARTRARIDPRAKQDLNRSFRSYLYRHSRLSGPRSTPHTPEIVIP